MKLTLSKVLLVLAISLITFPLVSCKQKNSDADIQAAIVDKAKNNQEMAGVTAAVNNGVVTLSGECKDATCKNSCEQEVKEIKGVKQVINNISLAAAQAPVEITADEPLNRSVNDVVKDYKGVSAEVNNGVVTLTGDIKRDDLQKLMASIHSLKPKSVENKLTVKN